MTFHCSIVQVIAKKCFNPIFENSVFDITRRVYEIMIQIVGYMCT